MPSTMAEPASAHCRRPRPNAPIRKHTLKNRGMSGKFTTSQDRASLRYLCPGQSKESLVKPSFKSLWANYPKGSYDSIFNFIGWQEFAGKPGWENTCAIRMSICLGLSGVSVSSRARMRALKGPAKGKMIEPRQDYLSLTLQDLWGTPLKCSASEGPAKLAGRDGVISFWKIAGYAVGGRLGGHIDLIDGKIVEQRDGWGRVTTRRATYEAAHGNYMDQSETIWFWEMPK